MTTITAREYLRVSQDRSGRQRSNDEQADDNRRTWDFAFNGECYSDAISASRYGHKIRGGFDKLVRDLRTGRFGADMLVLWESSRGSRKVSEWVALIELCEEHGVRIAVTADEHIYDPANARDRKSLIDAASDAEYESAKISGRVKRSARANATARRPHGKVLFGYRRTYEPGPGGKPILVGQEPHPDQAAIVRRVYGDFLGGRSLRSIAAELNAEGVRTNRGNGWTVLMIRRMLTNRAYIGHRTHRGTDFGQGWEPLVDEATFEAVARRLESISFRRPKITQRLCSGVARCGNDGCGARLEIKHSGGVARYGCQGCYSTYRRADDLDRWVTAAVVGRLSMPDVGELLGGREDPKLTEARARANELRAELAEAMALWKAKRLSTQAYATMEADLLPQLANAERAVRAAAVPISVDVPPSEAVPAWWDGLDHEIRREVVHALIASVVVRPVGKGCRRIDWLATTTIEWRR